MVSSDQKTDAALREKAADNLLEASGEMGNVLRNRPTSLIVIYSCGDFRAATKVARSDDTAANRLRSRGKAACPRTECAFFSNPFSNLDASPRRSFESTTR